jgi:hypothetical protein
VEIPFATRSELLLNAEKGGATLSAALGCVLRDCLERSEATSSAQVSFKWFNGVPDQRMPARHSLARRNRHLNEEVPQAVL